MDQKLQVPAAIWTVSRKGDGDKERQDRLFSWSRATRTPLKLLGAWETTVLKNRSKGPRARLPGESWKGFFLFVCFYFNFITLCWSRAALHTCTYTYIKIVKWLYVANKMWEAMSITCKRCSRVKRWIFSFFFQLDCFRNSILGESSSWNGDDVEKQWQRHEAQQTHVWTWSMSKE